MLLLQEANYTYLPIHIRTCFLNYVVVLHELMYSIWNTKEKDLFRIRIQYVPEQICRKNATQLFSCDRIRYRRRIQAFFCHLKKNSGPKRTQIFAKTQAKIQQNSGF